MMRNDEVDRPDMRHSPSYSPEAKARAIASLLVGERPRVVARKFAIPESTVTTWRHRLKNGKLRHEKKDAEGSPGGLLLDYLEALLRTLAADSERLADPDALREIPPGQLAVIYGTLFDRTLRMLELAPAQSCVPGLKYFC
jgi:transposase-like protein